MAPNDAFVTSFFQIPYTSAVSYARLWQKHAFHLFWDDAETAPDTRLRITCARTAYQALYSSSAYCCRCSLQQEPRSYWYKERGDAVRIEPPPTSPSTCHLWVRGSRTLFRHQASGDGAHMPSVLGESTASCRLSSRAGSNQTQAHSNNSTSIYELPARAPQLLTMAHIRRIVPPDAIVRVPGCGPGECGLVRDRFSLCMQL